MILAEIGEQSALARGARLAEPQWRSIALGSVFSKKVDWWTITSGISRALHRLAVTDVHSAVKTRSFGKPAVGSAFRPCARDGLDLDVVGRPEDRIDDPVSQKLARSPPLDSTTTAGGCSRRGQEPDQQRVEVAAVAAGHGARWRTGSRTARPAARAWYSRCRRCPTRTWCLGQARSRSARSAVHSTNRICLAARRCCGGSPGRRSRSSACRGWPNRTARRRESRSVAHRGNPPCGIMFGDRVDVCHARPYRAVGQRKPTVWNARCSDRQSPVDPPS